MIYLGIDVGLTGAISLLDADGKLLDLLDMPTMDKQSSNPRATVKRQLNGAAIRERIDVWKMKDSLFAFIERVNTFGKQGIATNGSLMHSLGMIEGIISTLCIPYALVTPVAWKRHFKLGKDKELARQLTIRLYPTASLSRKKDSNRAEAILIARYGVELSEDLHRAAETVKIQALSNSSDPA